MHFVLSHRGTEYSFAHLPQRLDIYEAYEVLVFEMPNYLDCCNISTGRFPAFQMSTVLCTVWVEGTSNMSNEHSAMSHKQETSAQSSLK